LWLASPNFYPTYGGAQNRYRSYIPGFIERGLEVHVVTGTPLASERSEADRDADWYAASPGIWLPRTSVEGAELERIRLPDSNDAARLRTYYSALVEVCSRPAAGPVIAQMLTYMRPEARPWLRRLRESGVATVFSISQFPSWQKKRLKRLLRQRGYRRLYNEVDAVITNSKAIEDFLHELGVDTRVEYIANGVNLQRFCPPLDPMRHARRLALREQFGLQDDARLIIAVGSVMPRKGPHLLIRAWRRLLQDFPATQLLFVGPRADQHDAKLAQFSAEMTADIRASGAAGQVHFTGVVDDVENYLAAADILVLASEREGTPNSVLEAMATGLPCVVTPFAGLSRAIGDAGVHYLPAERSAQGIAAALRQLLSDGDAARNLAARGHAFVGSHADQQHTLDRYAALYRELGHNALSRRAGQ
tara:strand:- start:3515 stop:4771 length:1257 start_codon:yes stop_codon:yes gene_type:complete